MALPVFISPENSLVQFYAIGADDFETCNLVLQKCLPIHYGYDFLFQLYVEGTVADYYQDNFVVKITDADGNVVSDEQPFSWEYDSVADRTWANLKTAFDITALAALGNRACANFQIFNKIYSYNYNITEPWGVPVTITILIDGITTPIGAGGTFTDLADFIAYLNSFLGSSAHAFHTSLNGLQIQAYDGHVYNNIIFDNGLGSGGDWTPTGGITSSLTPIYISNCLEYVSDTCWTTIVKYKSNENTFGFNYALDAAFYNSARLRMYYDNPQPVFDEQYFLKSDGAKKVLSARYEKEYQVHVDFSDEQRHFALAAAIKHDTVLMGRVTAATEYSCEGKYDIAWLNKPGTNLDSAQGSFAMRPTPFFQKNSNCVNDI